MNYKAFIGVDVSKRTIDTFIHGQNKLRQFHNDRQGYRALLNWVLIFQPSRQNWLQRWGFRNGVHSNPRPAPRNQRRAKIKLNIRSYLRSEQDFTDFCD